MNPLISIIIPVYNAEQYLERCIDSVIGQTYKNLEIILVDDGSKDTSPVICDKYAAQDSRIIVIHKENAGVSAARNDGIDAAKGEFIFFIDADDWIDTKYIEVFLKYKNYPMVISGYSRHGHADGERGPEKTEEVEIRNLPIVLKEYVKADDYWLFAWGKMFRTDIIKKNKLSFNSKMRYLEDSCFVMDYMSLVDKVILVKGYYLHHLMEKTKYSKYYMNYLQLKNHMSLQQHSFCKLEKKCGGSLQKFKEDVSRLHFNNFRRFLLWSDSSIIARLRELLSFSRSIDIPIFSNIKFRKSEKLIFAILNTFMR